MVSNIARQYGPREPPFTIAGGSGSNLEVEEHQFIHTTNRWYNSRKESQQECGYLSMFDATAGYWNNILGMDNYELMEIKQRVGGTSFHLYDEFTNPYAEKLASVLCDKFRLGLKPNGPELENNAEWAQTVYQPYSIYDHPSKVIFANSGSGACENARKEAVNYFAVQGWKEENLLFATIKGSYHGSFGPMLRWINPERNPVMVECPIYRQEGELESLVESWIEKVKKIEKTGNRKVAGFFFEPVMGVRGAVELPEEKYLNPILQFCKERDILTISDEVTTGMGRAGYFDSEKVPRNLAAFNPGETNLDMICFGKALSAGYYPLAVTLLSSKVVSNWDRLKGKFYHERGNSLAGTPEACAIGLEVLRILSNYYPVHIQDMGKLALSTFREKLAEIPSVREIRGRGLLIAIDVRDSKLAHQAKVKMRQRGINFIPEGRMIMFCPAYNIYQKEINDFAEQLEATLKELG